MAKVIKSAPEYQVLIDSREQSPYEFKNSVVGTIPIGDYSIVGLEGEVSIEHKTLIDLFGTLGGGHTRFKNELMRARDLEFFAIVVDGTLEQIQKKDFPQSYLSKMQGFVIIKQIHSIMVRYKIPVILAKDRAEGRRVVKEFLEAYLRSRSSTGLSKRRLAQIGLLLGQAQKPSLAWLRRNLQPPMNQTYFKTHILHLEKEGLIRLNKKGNTTEIEVIKPW